MVRVWLPDSFPSGSESCAIGKAIRSLKRDWEPLTKKNPKAVITFADYEFMHKAGVSAIFGPGTVVTASADQVLNLLGQNT